jgi:hypothetical protein
LKDVGKRRVRRGAQGSAFGCGSTGNLRTGAEALGNTAYSDVGVFQEIIRAWAADLREHISNKFGY